MVLSRLAIVLKEDCDAKIGSLIKSLRLYFDAFEQVIEEWMTFSRTAALPVYGFTFSPITQSSTQILS